MKTTLKKRTRAQANEKTLTNPWTSEAKDEARR
jgi:hypothetical protein